MFVLFYVYNVFVCFTKGFQVLYLPNMTYAFIYILHDVGLGIQFEYLSKNKVPFVLT
jgi:hypothetical protein